MEYTVQNLEYAVSVFYNGQHNERAEAHQWLTTAQRCPQAWSFVWELLQPTKGTEVQFFAATTLHTKLLRCWAEVPPESHEELKNKILHAVLSYSVGPKIVLNRLCISLAAFILQQGSADLAVILQPLSSAENMTLLLEVLTVIPEEFNSMTMGTTLRVKNRVILQRACPAVLDDMLRYLQSVYSKEAPSEETIHLWYCAAVCAASWLSLGGEQGALREHGTATVLSDRLPLCHALLNVVHVLYTHHEVISDTALEACEASLGAVRAAGAAPDAVCTPHAALQLISELAALAQPILARDNVPNSINEELLAALATCAVALAECHTRCIVQAIEQCMHEGARQFLELLLASQAAPGHYPIHETRSQLVFGAWYTLQDEVLCLSEDTEVVSDVWKQLFSRLLTILIHKGEAPAEDALSKDDAELLRCYRQDIGDTVMYCYGVLGEHCFTIVEEAWRLASSSAGRESALHVLLALGDTAPQQCAAPLLVAMLEHAVAAASCSDVTLVKTALECLGAYSWWMAAMEDAGPPLAMSALRAAGSALTSAPAAAALALKKLSSECSTLAAPLAGEIVVAAQSSRGRRSGWVRRQLLGAAGAALSAADAVSAAPLLRGLAASLLDEIQEQSAATSKSYSGVESAGALLTALAARTDLAAELFRTILPALPPYSTQISHVAPLLMLVKQAVSTLMDDCLPMIEPVARLTMQACETDPCACGIDVAKLIVLMFGSQWAEGGRLLHACTAASARQIAANPSKSPDLTEALFSSLQAITKKKPRFLEALDDLLPQLVDLGCDCIRVWEANAARAACGWLAVLAAERPAALHARAPHLTTVVLRCIGGATPRNQVDPLAELLLALNCATWPTAGGVGCGEGLASWLRTSLAHNGFPSQHATDQHKQKFIADVIKEKSSKRRLLESVQAFSLLCRGLVGTEYARQTLAAKQLVS